MIVDVRESPGSSPSARAARAVVCLLVTAVAWAQSANRVPQWDVVSLAKSTGLGGATIFALAEGEDDSLWIASAEGLIHYDGYTTRRFGEVDGLPSDYVRCVLRTTDGELWVGTDSGAGVFDGVTFDARGSTGNLAGPSIRRIVEEADGTLWFCCDRWPDRRVTGGLTRFSAGEWTTYGTADGLPSDYVSDLFVSAAGERFVLTRQGLARMEGERFDLPWREASLPSTGQYVWSMVESPVHGLLAGTRDGFFRRRPGEGWEFLGRAVPGAQRPKLLATADGAILLHGGQSHDRFYAWDGEAFAHARVAPLSHDAEAEFLLEARDGSIWCSGHGMLVRWERSGGPWSYEGDMRPELVDGDGVLWASDAEGSRRLAAGRWLPVPDMFPPLIVDGEGSVWGRHGDGLGRWNGSNVEPWSTDRLGLVEVTCWCAADAGKPWVGGVDSAGQARIGRLGQPDLILPKGLRCWRLTAAREGSVLCTAEEVGTETFRLFRAAYSLEPIPMPAGVRIYEPPWLSEDSRGRLWLRGFFGLMRRDGSEWYTVEGLPGRHVTVVQEHGSAMWIGTRGTTGGEDGLVCLRNDGEDAAYPFTVHNVVGRDTGSSILLSGRTGFLCVLTERGPPRLLSLPVPVMVHTAVAHDGAIWVGTSAGMFRYTPDGIPPQTLLDSTPETVPDRQSVALHVRAESRFRPWSPEEHYLVSIKVDDESWSPFEPLIGQVVELGRLPPGQHRIDVRVMDADGDFDPTPATWRFRVLPAALQSHWWFWVLLVLGLGAMGGLTGMALRSRAVRAELRRRLAIEERFRVLVEHSPYCIHELDLDGKLTSVNAAGLRMLEVECEDQVVGHDFTGAAKTEDQGILQDQFERAVRGATCEFRFTSTNNKVFRSFLAPVRDSSGRVARLVGVSEDVTERLQLEAQLQHARKMEAMGRLAGGVAHDFNNLLTAVLGNVGLARELGAADLERNPALDDLLGEIERAGNRAAGLTRQLLAFARQQPIRPEILKPGEVVTGMRGLLERLIPSSVKASIHCSEMGLRVRMDRSQFEQVVMNLALNGAEAMPRGGELTIRLEEIELAKSRADKLGGIAPGRYVVLRVHDQGLGMDRDTLERVFEPFFSTKPVGRGTGLGLATVHGIVQQAGGHVEVRSQLGRGSCFSVYLPAAAEPAARVPHREDRAVQHGEETVLLCEDEEAVRVLLQAVLTRFGYRVLAAASGDEALAVERAYDGPVHMLITDLVMPGMGGRALAEAFSARRPGAGVLFISGFVAEDAVEDARLLTKPFSTSDLLREVRGCLDESRVS